jgi:hypothetical protein
MYGHWPAWGVPRRSLTVVPMGCASPGRVAARVATARRQPAFLASWELIEWPGHR